MNKRRTLLAAVAVGGLMAPLVSFGQQPSRKVWRIGFLWQGEQLSRARIDAFNAGMRELGYAEGRDYTFEFRSARNDFAQFPALVAELVALKVDLIIASGTPAAVAARQVTREIPILSLHASDPVEAGLAATLRQPGGNVTGLTSLGPDLYTKRLDLLRQVVPGMKRVGFLYNPDNAGDALNLRQFEVGCRELKITAVPASLRKVEEVAAAFAALKAGQVQGLISTNVATGRDWRQRVIDYAAKNRLPAIYNDSLMAESGGFMAYGVNYPDIYRRAAAYADKIFKGVKPGDLPIQQPTKFELYINMKTAKALGVRVPQSILVSADKVIE